MRALLFHRNLTTNQMDISSYDYYFCSRELIDLIYLDLENPTKESPKINLESPRVLLVKNILKELELYLGKKIILVDPTQLKAELIKNKITSIDLYLPTGETSIFETESYVTVIRSSYSKLSYNVSTYTSFFKSLSLEHYKLEYTPRLPTELKVYEILKAYGNQHMLNYSKLRSLIKTKTTGLAPYVALGVISFEHLISLALKLPPSEGLNEFIRQLGWILYTKLKKVPPLTLPELSSTQRKSLDEWIKGQLPSSRVNDVLNRELKQLSTQGFVSNRSRLILVYVLVKICNVYWQYGQLYFRGVLLDYHPKVNRYNWYAQNKNRFLSSYNLDRQIGLYD